jgi:hypothetical protein
MQNNNAAKTEMKTSTALSLADATALYEAANYKVMTTSTFTYEGRLAKEALAVARANYTAALKAHRPSWIVI